MQGTVRGRIAPTPTGYLHLGHAATFATAWQRVRDAGGTLIFRMEDLDPHRCKKEFAAAAVADLAWLGIHWDEGPDENLQDHGPFAPYFQSQRIGLYLAAWRQLLQAGYIFPCTRSRRDMQEAPRAPHGGEPVYPCEWRPPPGDWMQQNEPGSTHWRFRVPIGRTVCFRDERCGEFCALAGMDFGDFPVWRADGVPSYELAVVVDDLAMGITEVVRGEDLLLSTCRQLLLYEALGGNPPRFFHTPLLRDEKGTRLAKRTDALAIRTLRDRGMTPVQVLQLAREFQSSAVGSRSPGI